jgi:hypothetical protein
LECVKVIVSNAKRGLVNDCTSKPCDLNASVNNWAKSSSSSTIAILLLELDALISS